MRFLPQFNIDGDRDTILAGVRDTEIVPRAIHCWTAHVARDLLRLGVYFHAVALWYRIPGVNRYRFLIYDDNDENAPNLEDFPPNRLGRAGRTTILNVLAECLRRLNAEWFIRDVPGGRKFQRQKPADEWAAYLDRQAAFKSGLLSVVAGCLDELIVHPGMAEIDAAPEPTWWQKWWEQVETED